MDSKERYINPFTDFGFKKLFGTEFNKELLIDFLNQVLGEKERIHDLTYLNTENLGNTEIDRKAFFDLYCKNERGEKFIIELQNAEQLYFKDRSIFYSTFAIQSQAPKGKKWDYSLKAVYAIGILNFSLPDQSEQERYQREIQLMDRQTQEIFYDKLTFIYLEVPNFKKTEDELVSQFDKWMYVLKNLHQLQNRPVKLQEKVFERLFNEAEIAKLKPEDMKAYEESLKVYRDNYSIIETAVNKKAVEIARELKRNGVSTELIQKSTKLRKEQIERL